MFRILTYLSIITMIVLVCNKFNVGNVSFFIGYDAASSKTSNYGQLLRKQGLDEVYMERNPFGGNDDVIQLRDGHTVKCRRDKGLRYKDFKIIPSSRGRPNIHPESDIIHQYLDHLCGLELGAASYAPFGLKSAFVGLTPELDAKDAASYDSHQRGINGVAVKVDIPGFANNLSLVPDSAADFFLASHVLEHLPDPIGAIIEWIRVVRVNGYVAIMVPHRKNPFDKNRNVTLLSDLQKHFNNEATAEERSANEGVGYREHYNVFDTNLFLEVCQLASELSMNTANDPKGLELVHYQELDDIIQVGNIALWRVVLRTDSTSITRGS